MHAVLIASPSTKYFELIRKSAAAIRYLDVWSNKTWLELSCCPSCEQIYSILGKNPKKLRSWPIILSAVLVLRLALYGSLVFGAVVLQLTLWSSIWALKSLREGGRILTHPLQMLLATREVDGNRRQGLLIRSEREKMVI